MTTCVYVTAGWGIHDDRWVQALEQVGHSPAVVSLGRDAADAHELRTVVLAAATTDGLRRPVLAGPLHTVTRELVDLPVPVIGLSWGYDLSDLHARGADLTWLHHLAGLIIDSEANRAIARGAGVDPARITFLPWGIDLDSFTFHTQPFRAADYGAPEGAPLVVTLRAHEPRYRVQDVLEAFAATGATAETAPDGAPFLIVGHTGSLTPSLRRLADDLGIADRVSWIGSVDEHDLVPLLSNAAAYVTASEVDGTSVTLLQAMACGAPVIASATAGNLGWVEDGITGFTFPTGDVGALAALIDRVTGVYPEDVVTRARARVERDANWRTNLDRLARAMSATQ